MPMMVDLFSGLGGWAEGGLAAGYFVVGFDLERHVYGEHRYPGHLVLQDVLTLHGRQFRDAALIVASPPCQEFSYMSMPWSRGKAKAAAIRADESGKMLADLTRLFDACFRIQREACEAAGRHIPMVVENVRGAQLWVGPAVANFGSFYLWGDVPVPQRELFGGGSRQSLKRGQDFTRVAGRHAQDGVKNDGSGWRENGTLKSNNRMVPDGTKNGNDWFGAGADCSAQRRHASKSTGRKFGSAMIAKIPFPLAHYIAETFRP